MKWIFTITLLIGGVSEIKAQFSEKQIENFSSSPNDTQRFVCGMEFESDGCHICNSTTASHSSEFTDPAEGDESVRMNYSMIGGSATNEYARLLPQWPYVYKYYFSDLGYAPYGLKIQIKGEEGNTDKFRMMLIEDTNLDLSIWDSEEAFYYVNDTVLGNAYWQEITIPYSAFSPLTTGVLDLNRVRGYTLDILNTSSTAHQGSVCFDDLRQLTTTAPQKDSVAMAGTFVIYNDFMDNWTSDQWRGQIQLMKDVCMKKVILQFTQSASTSYYSNASGTWINTETSIVDSIVKAAELENFGVVFGLSTNSDCSITSPNASACTDELIRNQSIVDDLFDKFGASPAFDGWYITKEFWDARITQSTVFTDYYQQLSSYCKSYDSSKTVSIAPAIFLNYPADVYADWMNDFLLQCPSIDIVYFQDMGGRLITDSDVDLPHYFGLMKEVCETHGKIFGVDIESFHEINTCDALPYNYRTKTLDELKEQLYSASVYSDEIVNYCWQYFYLYGDQLYLDYEEWITDFWVCEESETADVTVNNELKIHVFPNPAQQVLYIQLPDSDSEIEQILLYDVSGVIHHAYCDAGNNVDVSGLAPGIYFLDIVVKDKSIYTCRFVKQ